MQQNLLQKLEIFYFISIPDSMCNLMLKKQFDTQANVFHRNNFMTPLPL